MKKKNLTILSIAMLIFFIYGVAKWNDGREKNLRDVLDSAHIEKVYFKRLPIKDEMAYNRQITDDDSLKELLNFFSQYTVKKVGDRDFFSEYPDEQFQFQLEYKDTRTTMPSLIERDILLHDQYQYEITNGPVDYEWLEDFVKDKGEEV
ncbi:MULTISPECIES: hypothetical protein [Mesobacillus]|uniref:Uncharacterized protein n=1 Tax=Mesobacillus selenatarsenatis TaxID=388741 RepID=A0A846TFQ2_9BACI|nr:MULTISPECIES: hypothetical protein [Mesobacillus]NKE04182.1 hypothetical protein [Mesobacillus selenatarsenatis]